MIFCPCDQSMSLGEVQGLGLGKELNYSDQAYTDGPQGAWRARPCWSLRGNQSEVSGQALVATNVADATTVDELTQSSMFFYPF